jgi:hypothetical protein
VDLLLQLFEQYGFLPSSSCAALATKDLLQHGQMVVLASLIASLLHSWQQ